MEQLLNSHSALHNFKQANGLYVVNTNSVKGYILERRLKRILEKEITPQTIKTIAKEIGLSYSEVEDLVEGKLYKLDEEALRKIIETYFENGVGACLKAMESADH